MPGAWFQQLVQEMPIKDDEARRTYFRDYTAPPTRGREAAEAQWILLAAAGGFRQLEAEVARLRAAKPSDEVTHLRNELTKGRRCSF
jgi:hypothetical protein